MRRTATLSKMSQARKAPEQKRPLTNLIKVTEDDADGIISTQRLKKERRYSLDRVLRKSGIKLGR